MKKVIFLLLFLALLLAGCGEPEPQWPGYSGPEGEYTYCHTQERDLKWEEDILFLAKTCLETHPYLVEGDCWTDVYEAPFAAKKSQFLPDIFDPQRKEAFLKEVNDLIPRIPELTDIQMGYEARRLVASIGDIHSNLQPYGPNELVFPLVYTHFQGEAGVELYGVRVPEGQEDILMGKLVSINDVPIAQIIQDLAPYVGGENEYYLPYGLADGRTRSLLSLCNALQAVGVMGVDETSARFAFETGAGTVECQLTAVPASESAQTKLICHPMSTEENLAYSRPDNYWYQWLSEKVLYIRLASLSEQKNYTFYRFISELSGELSHAPQGIRLVLDFRDNTGGPPYAEIWSNFVQSVKDCNPETVHILINGKCISSGVAAPYQLAEAIPGAVLAGSPTAQFPNSAAGQAQYTLPNSGYPFFVSQMMFIFAPGQSEDSVHPDLLLYQTLEDYENCVDTVLEAVLSE